MNERSNVAERVSADDVGKRRLQAVTPSEGGKSDADADAQTASPKRDRLTLVIDQLPHAAYMVNHKFEVTWFNDQARLEIPGLLDEMPPRTEDRSIFRLLLESGGDEIDRTRPRCCGLTWRSPKSV